MRKNPPFATSGTYSEGLWFDRLAALLPPIAMAVLTGGARGMVLIIIAALAAAAVEGIFCLVLQRERFSVTPVVMGLTVAMVCPVTVPVGIMAAGSAIAAAITELLLLYKRSGLVSPSAAAWLIMLIIAPGVMSVFPATDALKSLPAFQTPQGFYTADSIAVQLREGFLPNITWQNLLFGNTQGGLGSVTILAILLSFVYLAYRRSGAWEVTVSLMVTVFVLLFLTNRIAVPFYQLALLHMSGGSLFFAAVFMVSDTSAPKTRVMRILYGVVCGFAMVEMRKVGFDEFSVPFAVVSTGLLFNLCERWGYRLLCNLRQRRAGMVFAGKKK